MKLLARGKPVNIESILSDSTVGKQLGTLAGAEPGERIGGGAAGVADAAAVNDGDIAVYQRERTAQVIKQGLSSTIQ